MFWQKIDKPKFYTVLLDIMNSVDYIYRRNKYPNNFNTFITKKKKKTFLNKYYLHDTLKLI